MQVALSEHPEWQGDWEKPAGIEEAEINPKTGMLATAEDLEKRMELFINGTGPNPAAEVPVEEASPTDEQPEPSPPIENPVEDAAPPTASPSPSPSPRAKPPDAARLEGTITLDIDPTTGLIAVETCPVIRTKTFILGTEPKKYCGPEYHRGQQISNPGMSRPRVVGTP
jgi:membrane carboxypeptidase/penicillin-binding protein